MPIEFPGPRGIPQAVSPIETSVLLSLTFLCSPSNCRRCLRLTGSPRFTALVSVREQYSQSPGEIDPVPSHGHEGWFRTGTRDTSPWSGNPVVLRTHVRPDRAADRICARTSSLHAHIEWDHPSQALDVHPHESRIRDCEESDRTDGQRSTDSAGCILKDRFGGTINPGLPRQGDIGIPAAVARYEEPVGAHGLLDGRAQPPCRMSGPPGMPVKLPGFALPGGFFIVNPEHRSGFQGCVQGQLPLDNLHTALIAGIRCQFDEYGSGKSLMTIQCSAQKV